MLFARLQSENMRIATTQLLPGMLRSNENRSKWQESFNWDNISDAREELNMFRMEADAALKNFRSAMGSSPQKPDAQLAWAEQLFAIWKNYDYSGKLGKRDGGGRFQEFLVASASPIGIEVRWITLFDRIKPPIKKGRNLPK